MNSIEIIRAGRESYYLTLGKDDYYTGMPEPEGVFLGQGAEMLHLKGREIQEQDVTLKNLFQGLTPDGKTTLRQGMDTRRTYYSLVNPETKKTVTETSTRNIYLKPQELAAIRNGKPEAYSERLQNFCQKHQTFLDHGQINPQWLKQSDKNKNSYNLIDPENGEIWKTEVTRSFHLNRYEVNQIQGGDPKKYSRRLQQVIAEHQIDDPAKWLKSDQHRSVVAYDNVFSAPKDVSILWSLAPDQKTQAQILTIHERATREAIKYLEQQAFIRKGRGGNQSKPAQATFAVFTHTTSRELDPQLHSHAVMLNLGLTADGKGGALDGKKILAARYASGMIYQNELRRGLEQSFSLKTYDQPFQKDRGVTFGITGISQEIKDEFSRRSREFKQRIDPGMSAKQKRAEILKNRKPKVSVNNAELLKEWQARGQAQGFKWQQIVGKTRHQPLKTAKDYKLFYREVAGRLKAQERKGVGEHQLVSAIASASRGRLSSSQTFSIVKGFKETFLTAHPQENGKTIYSLNGKGHKALKYRTAYESIKETVKGLKGAHYQNRLAVLYATGKISRANYKKFTEGKGLPKSVIGIRTHEALGLISKRQAEYLLHQKRHPQPTRRNAPIKHRITKITIFEDTARPKKSPPQPIPKNPHLKKLLTKVSSFKETVSNDKSRQEEHER